MNPSESDNPPVPATAYEPQPAPTSGTLRLDMNEGPPPDPAWLAAVSAETLNRYPRSSTLQTALADHTGCDTSNILVTAGGDEAIDRCCRAYLAVNRPAVVATPTFEMITRYTRLAGAEAIEIPWDDAAPYPSSAVIDAARASAAGLIAMVTPNNPTGRTIDRDDIERCIAETDATIMLDLAYAEFDTNDLTDLAFRSDRVIAVRTFSKAWGLAGLRVGYAIGAAATIDRLKASGGPFSVSVASMAAAEAALRTGESAMHSTVAAVNDCRARLHAVLDANGIARTESHANFVFFRHPRASQLWKSLLDRGILVRRWPEHADLSDALRITCTATEPESHQLLTALNESLEETSCDTP